MFYEEDNSTSGTSRTIIFYCIITLDLEIYVFGKEPVSYLERLRQNYFLLGVILVPYV